MLSIASTISFASFSPVDWTFPFFRDCFPALLGSKVKRSLDSHINTKSETPRKKSLKASGNLLIGFSGGLGSTVLLDLISKLYLSNRTENQSGGRGGKDHPRNEPVWKEASVCYVEISGGFPGVSSLVYRFLCTLKSTLDEGPYGWDKAVGGRKISIATVYPFETRGCIWPSVVGQSRRRCHLRCYCRCHKRRYVSWLEIILPHPDQS